MFLGDERQFAAVRLNHIFCNKESKSRTFRVKTRYILPTEKFREQAFLLVFGDAEAVVGNGYRKHLVMAREYY